MLLDSCGRPLRRSIGFLREYRVERDTPVDAIELVDAIGSEEFDLSEDIEEVSFDD